MADAKKDEKQTQAPAGNQASQKQNKGDNKSAKKTTRKSPPKGQSDTNPKAAAADGNVLDTNSALPHGVVPDQVQLNQGLAQTLNNLQALRTQTAQLLAGSDWVNIEKAIIKAQDVVADRLGLEKVESGGYRTAENTPAVAGGGSGA